MEDLIDRNKLEEIYEKNRKCIIKSISGKIREAEEYKRMTLGFSKAMKVVNAAEISPEHIVMNIFGGAGGLLRLLGLKNPRLLIAVDKLYPGGLKPVSDWYYDTDSIFNSWVDDIKQLSQDIQIRRPVLCQYDILEFIPAFVNVFDRIIIDPPYGLVSEEALHMNETESRKVFIASIGSSLNYLTEKGKIISIIPSKWMECLNMQFKQIKTEILEEINGKYNFVIIQIVKL